MTQSGIRQVPRSPQPTQAARRPSPGHPVKERPATPAVPASRGVLPGSWEAWCPTAARIVLGLVLAWFGLHELLQPSLWTGYVPVLVSTSTLATWAVLAHGAVLTVLAVALTCGIAPRLAAAVTAALMAEIIVALSLHGLNDIVARDFGVFGLSLAVLGQRGTRLMLTR